MIARNNVAGLYNNIQRTNDVKNDTERKALSGLAISAASHNWVVYRDKFMEKSSFER